MSSSPLQTVVENEKLPEWFPETIQIKFVNDKEKIFPRDKIFLTDSKSTEIFGLTSIGINNFQYGKDNTDFKKKLTAIAHNLQLDLEFVHVKGDGNCLFRSFAKQLGLPEESYIDIKRSAVREQLSDEVGRASYDFNSSDSENFTDLLKFLNELCENVWHNYKPETSLTGTSELDPLAIILKAIHNDETKSAKQPEDAFQLLKAVISCVFGENSETHKVCICILSLASNCLH